MEGKTRRITRLSICRPCLEQKIVVPPKTIVTIGWYWDEEFVCGSNTMVFLSFESLMDFYRLVVIVMLRSEANKNTLWSTMMKQRE